jgi:hypothetical protein
MLRVASSKKRPFVSLVVVKTLQVREVNGLY